MKMILHENERALLFCNGIYRCMLGPGKQRYHPAWGQSAERVRVEGAVLLRTVHPRLLLRDKAFADCVTAIEVPDGHIAMHFVDGRITDALTSGEYYFWSIHQQHSFRLLDTSQPDATGVPVEYFLYIPMKLYTKLEAAEGECALLYYDGAFQRLLPSGAHYFWNGAVKVTGRKVDLRTQQMEISGQEILTADKVGLRLNFLCSFRVTDPVRITGELRDFSTQVYAAVQMALRRYVGGYRLDELLEQKSGVADFVLAKLREQQEGLYVEFTEAGLKDIILPGEIRTIMNTVLVAEKSAQANVISRREEVASTRSLLNTAKLLDENGTLRRLKELEYLERICERVGSISVGGGNLLAQLQELIATR